MQVTNDIQFIGYLLANNFAIEKTEEEIWSAIYADAGHNRDVAEQMVVELSDNRLALAEFATSLSRKRHQSTLYPIKESDSSRTTAAVVAGVLIGFVIGVVLTVFVSWS